MGKQGLVLGILSVWVCIAWPGCVPNDKSLVILFNVAPDDDCSWKVQDTGGATFIGHGLLDVTFYKAPLAPVYYWTPQVANYMPTNVNADIREVDAMRVTLEFAAITYEWLVGREILLADAAYQSALELESLPEVSVPLGISVGAGGSDGEPGQTVFTMRLIDPAVGSQLAVLAALPAIDIYRLVLGVHVVMRGTTVGGTNVSSNEFVYPIYLCAGCLTAECCPGTPAQFLATGCRPGQDSVGTCEGADCAVVP